MKQLRKDDGYVMVYVLIAFTVLALVAGSICAVALNNLKAQKADVARMEARYEAEGYLQQFVAEVETLSVTTPDKNFTDVEQAHGAAESLYWENVESFAVLDLLTVTIDPDTDTVTVQASNSEKTAKIEAKASVTLVYGETEYSTVDGEGQPVVTTWSGTCSTKSDGWAYMSYDISYQSAENAEGEVSE